MTRNTAAAPALPVNGVRQPGTPPRTIALIGLMGAGKTAIGRRLAARLSLPFRDADAAVEEAAGCTIAELFARHGEPAFRRGERQVIGRLLAGPPLVLATGGGAFMDPQTRALLRERATTIWLRAALPTLLRRTALRTHRPLLAAGDSETILRGLMRDRHPIYAEADIIVDTQDDSADATTARVVRALTAWRPPIRLTVPLHPAYDIVIGEGLLARAGALIAPMLPRQHAVIVADETVDALQGDAVRASLDACDIAHATVRVPPGEASKSLASYGRVAEAILGAGVERRSTIIALGGGVIGDLAGFAAATVLRGLPFVQLPTTLLAQVDSSVGGKTGINTAQGKNLLGAFHQPRLVVADIGALATLPPRKLRAGYAEIVKAGLIADAALFAWCEASAAILLSGDTDLLAQAVHRACAFKASVVAEDEREQAPSGGRALLNLGHTFAHALEAACGYDGSLLHGEAVAVGLGLAFRLSARLGHCAEADADRVIAHCRAAGLPATIADLGGTFDPDALLASMARDKKVRDGRLAFVLVRGIGEAFTSAYVPPDDVRAVLSAG